MGELTGIQMKVIRELEEEIGEDASIWRTLVISKLVKMDHVRYT